MDSVSSTRRSEIMARIRSRDTAPEILVRHLVYAMGYRYRLQASELPGKPDLVFRPRRKVIFVNGCFWHSHRGCRHARVPKTRVAFWLTKLEANRQRDLRNERALLAANWGVLTVWECEVGDATELMNRIKGFLDA